jgi:hypothetical protein
MKRFLAVLIFAALVAAELMAADAWDRKDFQKWSVQDCRKVLRDSPWGRTFNIEKTTMSQVNRDPFGQVPRGAATNTSPSNQEGLIDARVTYWASFRSAKPVREAFARLAQFDAKLDQMNSDQRKSFDERQQKFLTVAFPDKIIIHVSYETNSSDMDRDLALFWQTQTLATLKGQVYLTGPDGDRMEPVEYYVGKGALREFQFAFPRRADGDRDMNKPFSLEFQHPNIIQAQRVYLKFPPPSEMKFEGTVTY